MLELTSNVSGVLRQTERYVAHIPVAMEGALNPRLWQAEAMALARTTLFALPGLKPDEWKHIPAFLKSVRVFGAVTFTMTAPRLASAVALQHNLNAGGGTLEVPIPPGTTFATPLEGSPDEYVATLPNVSEVFADPLKLHAYVADWVANVKDWEFSKDREKTPGNILQKTQWIMKLLLAPPGSLSMIPYDINNMSEADARDHLMPHILEHITQKSQAEGGLLSPARAEEWLLAVLAAWRVMVRTRYPERVREMMRKNKKEDLL